VLIDECPLFIVLVVARKNKKDIYKKQIKKHLYHDVYFQDSTCTKYPHNNF
jgi:hypothetical protein